MTTPARNALLRGVPEYVTTHFAYGDFTKLEAMTEAVRVLLDGTVPPEQVLAALVESGWRPDDDDLRALGGHPAEDARWVPSTRAGDRMTEHTPVEFGPDDGVHYPRGESPRAISEKRRSQA